MTYLLLFLSYALMLNAALSRAGLRPVAAAAGESNAATCARILVVGATGGTGREVVRQALARGHEVTALVRNPARLGIEHARLSVVRGDVLDPAAVNAAMRGQQAVLCCLGHKRYFYPTRILSKGTRHLLRAMESHGAARLVCETSLGIGDSAWRMGLYYTFFVIPVILPFYFWDKTRQERLIAASPVEWVIVRPGALTNGPPTGSYGYGRRIGSLLRTVSISRADVADFMLNQLGPEASLRMAPGVCSAAA